MGSLTLVIAAVPMAAERVGDPPGLAGPILFRQTRIGQDGKPFRILKFRTMIDGAEALLPQLVDLEALGQPAFKLRDDPRVTRVGRFLRRWSLDELPQLFNVLAGEMSLWARGPKRPAWWRATPTISAAAWR